MRKNRKVAQDGARHGLGDRVHDPVLRRRIGAVVLTVGILSLQACGDSGTGPDAPNVASVTIQPTTVEIKTDHTVRLTVRIEDPEGAAINGLPISWKSEDPAVAVVDADGLVTGVSVGDTRVTVSVDGQQGAEASAEVTVVPNVGSIEVAPIAFDVQLGETVHLTATVWDPNGAVLEGFDVTWTSSDEEVATVSAAGMLTGTGGGDVVVTASLGGVSGEARGTVQSFRTATDVAVIDSTVLRLVSSDVERAAGTYRFDVIGTPVPDIQPDQVMVGAQGLGFLRRVLSVGAGGGVLVVTTSPAGLEELFEEGELGIQFDILSGDFVLSTGLREARFPGPAGLERPEVIVGPLMLLGTAPGVSLQQSSLDLSGFDVCKFFKNQGQPCPTIIDEFKLPKAKAELNTGFDIGARWTQGGLDEFHAIAKGTLDTDVAVSLGVKLATSYKKEATLAQVGRLITIQLGWLPVVLLVELEMKGKFEANATVKGKLQAGVTTNHTVQVGARWMAARGWDGVLSGSGGFTIHQPSVADTSAAVSVQLDAKVSLVPELHLYFYGLAGPFLSAAPFEAAKFLASTQECYAELSAGVEGAIGVAANDFLGANKVFPPYSKKQTFGQASDRWDCPVGNVRVNTVTAGVDLDPDGYSVIVDGKLKGGIDINDQVLYGDIRSGQRQVQLIGVAANCTVTSANPQTVEVTVNSTVDVNFQVECEEETTQSRILFTDLSDILSMNPDGTDIVNITNNGSGNDDPSYSPDRSTIVYSGQTGSASNLFVKNADGSGSATQLTFAGSGWHADPEFSPDGSMISYNRGGDVYVMPAAGGSGTVIASDAKFDANAEWHPGGGTLVFQSRKDDPDWEIYTIPAGGGGYNRITNSPGYDGDPTYSPDGSKILFRSDRNGPAEIWVMDAGGGGAVMLTQGEEPTWSPDGKKIAFVRGGKIWTANADGSNAVSTGVSGEEPCWR